MSFIWPGMLALLALLPLPIAGYVLAQRRRRRVVERYGSFGLAQAAPGRALGRRRHVPAALFLAGLALLLVGLARPQASVDLPRLEGTVVLAFDVSRSMAAGDVQPSRMEVAKAAARTFVENQPSGVQLGVVAFSDSGLAVQAPTSDGASVLAAIQRLQPQLGTSLGQGILAALNTISVAGGQGPVVLGTARPAGDPQPPGAAPRTPAVIVLFSDGDNNGEPDPLEAARAASERGVQIYTVGLGSATGADLELDGFTVHTQLDEDALRQLAEVSGGAYFNAAGQEDLQAIYDSVETQLVVRPEQTEVTALFAGAGILALLLGGLCSLLWLGRVP